MSRHSRTGFTLVELLVVIAIIGMLVAMIFPTIHAAREAAHRSACSNKMSKLALSMHNYEQAHEVLPPGTTDAAGPVRNDTLGNKLSWVVHLLPYIDEGNAYRQIDLSLGAYDPKHKPLHDYSISALVCPSLTDDSKGKSSYAGNHHEVESPIDADNHGMFFLNSKLRSDRIPDGASHTILLGEKRSREGDNDLGWISGTRATLRNTGAPIGTSLSSLVVHGSASLWPSPSDPTEDKNQTPEAADAKGASEDAPDEAAPDTVDPLLVVGGFVSDHPAGIVNFAFADGSVRSISSEDIDRRVYQALGHRDDGQLIDHQSY